MTETIEYLDLDSLIDFNASIECKYSTCQKEAKWIVWIIPCRCDDLPACDEHKKNVEDKVRNEYYFKRKYIHDICRTRIIGADWRPI